MTFNDFLLKIRPLINARGLENAAGIPKNTLGKHYRYADGKPDGNQCPQKHFKAIVCALCAAFGDIEIDWLSIICDQEGNKRAAFMDIEIDGLSITCDQEGNKHNNDQRCAPSKGG